MNIKTVFSCGDKAFVVTGHFGSEIVEYTVGQVRVEVTGSKGVAGMASFNNYKPQSGYKEEVMCVETGVRSGSIWTVGRNIFKTREEAAEGQTKIRAEHSEAIAAEEAYKAKRHAEDIAYHKSQLAALTGAA